MMCFRKIISPQSQRHTEQGKSKHPQKSSGAASGNYDLCYDIDKKHKNESNEKRNSFSADYPCHDEHKYESGNLNYQRQGFQLFLVKIQIRPLFYFNPSTSCME